MSKILIATGRASKGILLALFVVSPKGASVIIRAKQRKEGGGRQPDVMLFKNVTQKGMKKALFFSGLKSPFEIAQ